MQTLIVPARNRTWSGLRGLCVTAHPIPSGSSALPSSAGQRPVRPLAGLDRIARDSTVRRQHADTGHMRANVESILKLEVPLIVQIAQRSMPVKEVLSVVPGSIIELPKPADADLEILVNNKQIGTVAVLRITAEQSRWISRG